MVSYHLLLPRHWIINDGQQYIRRGSPSVALKNFAIIFIVSNTVVKDPQQSPTQTPFFNTSDNSCKLTNPVREVI